MTRSYRDRLTPEELRRIQLYARHDDFQRPADRLAPHRQPGVAPALGWLVFGVVITGLAYWALPDLLAWVQSWRQP